MLDCGGVGYAGLSGIYFAPSEAEKDPSLSYDFYKRHRSREVVSAFPKMGTVDVLHGVFGGDPEAPFLCSEAWNLENPLSANLGP